MPAPKFIQAKATTLVVSISAAETTEIKLKKLVDLYGNNLSMSDFSTTGYLTIDPGGDSEEIVSFTGFTTNSDDTVSIDTGITRGLVGKSPYGSGGTASSHAAGVRVVVSNQPQTYDAIIDYIDGIAIAGVADASESAKGIVEEATQAEVDAKTATGSTGAPLFVPPDKLRTQQYNDYVADTGVADAYEIAPNPAITAYAAGQVFTFKVGNGNTGASTLNVNSLGAKNIKKRGYDLGANDLRDDLIVQVVYDGTDFELVSAHDLYSEGFGDGSDGDVTISSPTTLTQDMYYRNLTVNDTLTTDGYKIYVQGVLSGTGTIQHSAASDGTGGDGGNGGGAGNGSGGGGGSGASGGIVLIYATSWEGTFSIESIGSDGGNGGNSTGGSGAGSGGTAGAQRGAGTFVGAPGEIGGAGSTGSAVGNDGTDGDAANPHVSGTNGVAGGTGKRTSTDNVSGGSGGAAGTATAASINVNTARFLAEAYLCVKSDGTLAAPVAMPGSGSGGGGGNDASPTESAGGGGGGGGNGGYGIVIYKRKTWTGTSDFSGGSGGTAGTGGEIYATHDGADGAAGSLLEFNWSQI